jgi:hypothetical protein
LIQIIRETSVLILVHIGTEVFPLYQKVHY